MGSIALHHYIIEKDIHFTAVVDGLSVTKEELNGNKIPHVGFNVVNFSERKGLFKDFPKSSDFYFTHSYRMLVDGISGRYATCVYGEEFIAAFEVGNVCGTQFHPEKSQSDGLQILKNFWRI